MNDSPAVVFFLMSGIYLAPHIDSLVGIAFGVICAAIGWYCLCTEKGK